MTADGGFTSFNGLDLVQCGGSRWLASRRYNLRKGKGSGRFGRRRGVEVSHFCGRGVFSMGSRLGLGLGRGKKEKLVPDADGSADADAARCGRAEKRRGQAGTARGVERELGSI